MLVSLLVPLAAVATTLRSITVDGSMGDWADVLVDPENGEPDAAGGFGDLDNPVSADRDLRGFACTWDASNLYLYTRRTVAGKNAWNILVYADLDHDGLMETTDRVIDLEMNGSSPFAKRYFAYVPVSPGGDALTGDGVDMPGTVGAEESKSIALAGSASGIEVEASIPWGAGGLGIPSGSALNFHVSISLGLNLPSQVEDNLALIDTRYARLALTSDHATSAAAGAAVDFSHALSNLGNGADVFDITMTSSAGYSVALYSDPNGDGDPADGALIALDSNGDGDFVDGFDVRPSASNDVNGNALPDGGSLAASASRSYVVAVAVPSGAPVGTVDRTTVTARSSFDPTLSKFNTDTTEVGALTVRFDQAKLGVSGMVAYHPNAIANATTSALLVNLSASASLGWPVSIYSDPNGDGDPADGVPIASVTVPASSVVNVVVVVTVPPGTPAGTQNTTTLVGQSVTPPLSDSAADLLTIAPRVQVTPNGVADSTPGQVIFYGHTVTNAAPFSDTFTLSATSSLGSAVTILSDPNGNGLPDDSVPIASTGALAAGGGSVPIIARVQLPSSAAPGATDLVTVQARSIVDGQTGSATDTTTIRRLATFSDPLYAEPADTFFSACARVYALAGGLSVNNTYKVYWYRPGGALFRTSPALSPDATLRVDDSYALAPGDPTGTYQIELRIKSGSNYVPMTPPVTYAFDVLPPSSLIDPLGTDKPAYDPTGEVVRVSATLNNPSDAHNMDSTATYVIFLDANADGVPTAGEFYISASGAALSWSAGNATHQTTGLDVLAHSSYLDSWQVGPVTFPSGDTWSVRATWQAPCGVSLATALATFNVCFAASEPVADAGPDQTICLGDAATIGTAAVAGQTYLWSPAAGLSNNTVAQPLASPSATTAYTVLVTKSSTGCTAMDSVLLTVDASPTPGSVGNTQRAQKLGGLNHLSWQAVPDAKSYNVYRDGKADMSTKVLLGNTQNLYWDDDVLADGVTLYFYKIAAKGCKEGPL